jgi:hypothetical protein
MRHHLISRSIINSLDENLFTSLFGNEQNVLSLPNNPELTVPVSVFAATPRFEYRSANPAPCLLQFHNRKKPIP